MPISVLNSGHGDWDSGAVANGLIEADINLNVAKFTKELMEFNGITTVLISGIAEVDEIVRQVNKIQGANLCHSIHHNSGGGDGSETIHSVFYGKGTEFAKIMQEEFDKLGQNRHGSGLITKLASDGVHDYFGFIRKTNPPAIISEYCFIDTEDYQSIDTYEEQYAEAEAIAKAHCRFYGITYKSLKTQSKQESENVKTVVVYYSSDDYSVALIAANKNGGCAMFNRNRGATVHVDVLSAEKVINIGGPRLGYKNEVYWSGLDAEETALIVLNGLKGDY
jgi:N-acetylmuramoyl-L-alanine amidase